MGIFINRNNVIDKAQAMRKNIYETKHQASLIFQSINNFDDTKYELMGKAWDGAREYASTVQLPVLRMYIECLELESEACEKYSSAASKLPRFEKLDEDVITKARERYDKAWDREFMRNHPRQTVLNYYEKKVERCNKLLNYIYDFIDETSGIFSETQSRQEELYRLHCRRYWNCLYFAL